MEVPTTRTYLDMTSPLHLRESDPGPVTLHLEARPADDPVTRRVSAAVGGPYAWTATWRDAEGWQELSADPYLHRWLIVTGPPTDEPQVGGEVDLDVDPQGPWPPEPGRVAGAAILGVRPGGDVEIDEFGLMPPFVGRGLGGPALGLVVRLAWQVRGPNGEPTRRVWLHTNTSDHPHALDNYRARGFAPFHSHTHLKRVPDDTGAAAPVGDTSDAAPDPADSAPS